MVLISMEVSSEVTRVATSFCVLFEILAKFGQLIVATCNKAMPISVSERLRDKLITYLIMHGYPVVYAPNFYIVLYNIFLNFLTIFDSE